MILSTQSFSSDMQLKGCGVDIENIDRFNNWAEEPPPFIYSPKEIELLPTFTDKLVYLCSVFCIKEALFKALQKPYNFNECIVEKLEFGQMHNLQFESGFTSLNNFSYGSYLLEKYSKRLIIGEVYLFQ